jgi:hypothetical protein
MLSVVILQPIAHVRMRQRITGVSAYFDHMRVADTIDSQKSEDRDITDKLLQMLPATKCRKYFTFTQVKSSAAYIRVIFKFLA